VEHKFEHTCTKVSQGPDDWYNWVPFSWEEWEYAKVKPGELGCDPDFSPNDDQYGSTYNYYCLDNAVNRDKSKVCGEPDTLVQGFEMSWNPKASQMNVHNLFFHRPSNPQGHHKAQRSGDNWVRCSSGFLWGIHERGGADTFNEVGCLKPDSLADHNQGSSRSFNMRENESFDLNGAPDRYFFCLPGMFISGISAQHFRPKFQVECRYMSSPRNPSGDYSLSSLRANVTVDGRGQ